MKARKLPLLILATSLTLGAAGLWAAVSGSLPQANPNPAPAPEAPLRPLPRRLSMDFLRWQWADPREQALQSQREAEEWTKLVEFIKDNSPNRYLLLLRQSPAPQPGSLVRVRLLQRWLNMQQLQHNQPDLYNLRVDQFKAEDVMIGLVAQLRQARREFAFARARQIRQQVREEAYKLVELGLKERQVRIRNAQDELSRQESQLEQDLSHKEQLAQERSDQILRQAERGFGGRRNIPQTEPSTIIP